MAQKTTIKTRTLKNNRQMGAYRQGMDLLVGFYSGAQFKPFGYSTGCKISDSAETGQRVTKEMTSAQTTAAWKEKYIKSVSETITAEGFVYDDVAATSVSMPNLKEAFMNRAVVTVRYKYRNDDTFTYEGSFIITSLEHDGPADDDEKWSITLENSGPVVKITA